MKARGLIATLAAAGALAAIQAGAYGQLSPLNDLLALGQGTGDSPPEAPLVRRAEPPLVATPLVPCGPGSREQPDVDGRVPEGSAKDGLNCNLTLVGHQGTEGGFKVLRYIDRKGRECAFYDTTLMFPFNALNPGAGSEGVAVLDMSDPAHPRQTETLTTPPMLSPHESLNLNARRGLLAAVNGNLTTEPGLVAIYSVRDDCRHPELQSLAPVARYGHESGFSADGKTFYATSTALRAITAVDVTDPKAPHAIWQGNVYSHGMTLSGTGNRAYIADPGNDRPGNMLILDTSEIQARKDKPRTREISRLTWKSASIPQNAIPFTRDGRRYVLEIDEYTQGTASPSGDRDAVGGARIIDISNEKRPRVVSNMRLRINQPAEHRAAREAGDPGTGNPAQGYAAHYCNVPTSVDPLVVACSFIASGLRVFDITDIRHPTEIGYYVAPPQPRSENGYTNSDFAMSKPAFAPRRREIWWSDGTTGFNVLRVAKRVWPTRRTGCLARRSPIGPRNIGRVRLGLSRRALLRRLPAPRRRSKRSWSWCVKGGKGRVSAAFTRRGRVALVATTAPHHGNRRVHPGTRVRILRRAYPRLRAVGRRLVRANPRSRRLFGVRRGRVRYVAVTFRRTIARRARLRAYLRLAL